MHYKEVYLCLNFMLESLLGLATLCNYLTSHHHKRGGKPVMIEHQPLRAGKCEVECNRWRRLLVWTPEPNIIEFDITRKIHMCYVV